MYLGELIPANHPVRTVSAITDWNLGLELQLWSIEDDIVNDQLFPTPVKENGSSHIILKRLRETYMSRLVQGYDISVSICQYPRSGRPGETDARAIQEYSFSTHPKTG